VSNGLLIQAGAVFSLTTGLAAYVAGQRPRTWAHHTVLAILGAILACTGGIFLTRVAPEDPRIVTAGVELLILGFCGIAPLWLYLAARCARVAVVEESPRAALAALLAPPALSYAAFLTNPLHHLFATGPLTLLPFAPAPEWAGPLFWVHSALLYGDVVVGIVLCAGAALRTRNVPERRRLLLLSVATLIPMATTMAEVSGLAPAPVMLTPAGLGGTALLLVVGVVRYRLLESLPLPARDVLEHLGDGLVLTDPDGRVLELNAAAERLLARPRHVLLGLPLEAVLRALDPTEALLRAVAGSEEDSSAHSAETPDERSLEISAGFVRGAARARVGRFLVLRDRTEQRRYERLRLQTQRLKGLGVLAAGIAHEINNPLAFVRANLGHLDRLAEEIAKESDAPRPCEAALGELREVVRECAAGVDRITVIVDTTRRLSREAAVALGPVDLNAVVVDALHLAGLRECPDLALEVCLDPVLPPLHGSAERLSQVVLNLLVNARQAVIGAADARVRVETAAVAEGAELRVHDNGPGVPPVLRDRIFDPFFTTKPPDEGMGLGLAIAFEIVSQHSGGLEVGPSREGGACFTVRLPAKRGAGGSSQEPSRTAMSPRSVPT
jgi:signal transduction histidine kinase